MVGLTAQHSLLSFCPLMGTASSRSPNKQRLRYIHNKKIVPLVRQSRARGTINKGELYYSLETIVVV